jgi:hypothetical protein
MAGWQLTPKQERWFQIYMEIGNGSETYRRASDCALMSGRAIRVGGRPKSIGAADLRKANANAGEDSAREKQGLALTEALRNQWLRLSS